VSAIPEHIRAVFFDVVGTVLFPQPGAPSVYVEAARRGGVELDQAEVRARFLQAYTLEEERDRALGWVTSEEREELRWRNIVAAALPDVSDADACFEELYRHFQQPGSWRLNEEFDAVADEARQRGLVLGLGSNYDHRLWSVLEGFPELAPLRPRTIISSVVGYRKPAAEFFDRVVHAAGCRASEVLFVGDDLANDYSGALAAGLNAVLLDEGQRHDVPHRITRLQELVAAPRR
jgi:putative hydrolase of the HAD superfamily